MNHYTVRVLTEDAEVVESKDYAEYDDAEEQYEDCVTFYASEKTNSPVSVQLFSIAGGIMIAEEYIG